MSGYVFHCTPCGFPHAGECAPKPAAPSPKKPWEVEITVGSRWRGRAKAPGGPWVDTGWSSGYEVLSIISDGTTENTRIQVRAYGAPAAAVWTLDVAYWSEDGFPNPMTHHIEQMVPW